jgi:outer membrane PBP1 activator LpoA protein
MRFLLILIATALAGCGGSAEDPATTEEMHTAADELQQTIELNMQKAEDVENKLQESVDALDAAVDEASGDH